jgi:hypothetical protein
MGSEIDTAVQIVKEHTGDRYQVAVVRNLSPRLFGFPINRPRQDYVTRIDDEVDWLDGL